MLNRTHRAISDSIEDQYPDMSLVELAQLLDLTYHPDLVTINGLSDVINNFRSSEQDRDVSSRELLRLREKLLQEGVVNERQLTQLGQLQAGVPLVRPPQNRVV